jgi:rRNA maturation endonuclease Nob1
MKYAKCPYCGKEYPVRDDILKCPACGGDLKATQTMLANNKNAKSVDEGEGSGIS